MSEEQVANRFSDTAGHRPIPPFSNVSGEPSPNTIMAPRDKGGATNSDVPGTGTKDNRRPIQIDTVTGQDLADADQAALQRAAGVPSTADRTRWPSQSARVAVHGAAVDAAAAALAAPIPGLADNLTTMHHAVQLGHDIGIRWRTERTLHRLFGDPASEE